jgi:3'-phosphoadenosine 5'-phosphosulfate (PAPS) 3'-phosphatase
LGLPAAVGCVDVHVVLCLCHQNYEYCWIIDPIDGTKEFIKRNGEFTVMIALVQVRECVGVCVWGGG